MASLYCEVVVPPLTLWQSEHWAVILAVLVQLGVACPPWQLVLEQVFEEGLKTAVPALWAL